MAQNYSIPNSLADFLDALLNSKTVVNAWAQNIIGSLRPRSGPMPGQLALMMDHKFGSKLLIQQLHKLDYCSSYSEELRYINGLKGLKIRSNLPNARIRPN